MVATQTILTEIIRGFTQSPQPNTEIATQSNSQRIFSTNFLRNSVQFFSQERDCLLEKSKLKMCKQKKECKNQCKKKNIKYGRTVNREMEGGGEEEKRNEKYITPAFPELVTVISL